MAAPLTILCLASYHKGIDLLRELRRQDCTVLLVTSKSLEDAEWPRDSIDEIFYMPDTDKQWDARDTLLGISHLARSRRIDRIVPLDDFDLEKAAAVREHLRVPGMGESQTRFFRDKLAMRERASQSGIQVPAFVSLVNDDQVREFVGRVTPPWILKPRLMAGTIGIRKLHNADELWSTAAGLGDQRSFYLLERFVAGDIFHVDSAMWKGASCERSSAGTVRRRLPSRMAEACSRHGWSSAARPTIGRCSLSARPCYRRSASTKAFHTPSTFEPSMGRGTSSRRRRASAAPTLPIWSRWQRVRTSGRSGRRSKPRLHAAPAMRLQRIEATTLV